MKNEPAYDAAYAASNAVRGQAFDMMRDYWETRDRVAAFKIEMAKRQAEKAQ